MSRLLDCHHAAGQPARVLRGRSIKGQGGASSRELPLDEVEIAIEVCRGRWRAFAVRLNAASCEGVCVPTGRTARFFATISCTADLPRISRAEDAPGGRPLLTRKSVWEPYKAESALLLWRADKRRRPPVADSLAATPP